MMYIPPGSRRVFNYSICKITYDTKETGYRCFGYDGPGRNDWLMSTDIDFSTVKDFRNGDAFVNFMFSTASGSTYQVANYSENPIGTLLKDSLMQRYKAATLTQLSEQEAIELFTNGVI